MDKDGFVPSYGGAPQVTEESTGFSPVKVWLVCLLLTPIVGAVLYYVWRRRHPAAARQANRASWVSFVVWAGILAATGSFTPKGGGEMSWNCKGTGRRGTLSCTFEAHDSAGEVCLDLVTTCDGQRTVAHTCSGRIRKNEQRVLEVASFTPPVAPTATCSDLRYENAKVR